MKWVLLIFLLSPTDETDMVKWAMVHTEKECNAVREWEHFHLEKTTSDVLVRSKCVNIDNFHNKIK